MMPEQPWNGAFSGIFQHQPMQASKSVETALAQDNKGIYSWSEQIKSKSIAQFCLIYAEKQPCSCVFS